MSVSQKRPDPIYITAAQFATIRRHLADDLAAAWIRLQHQPADQVIKPSSSHGAESHSVTVLDDAIEAMATFVAGKYQVRDTPPQECRRL